MMRKLNKRGAALVMVLVFAGALMLLGAAALSYSLNETIIAGYQAREAALYYIAEAGLEAGIAALRQDFNRAEMLTGALAGGQFTVTFSDISPERRLVTATATEMRGDIEKTLAVEVERDLDNGAEPEGGELRVLWIKS